MRQHRYGYRHARFAIRNEADIIDKQGKLLFFFNIYDLVRRSAAPQAARAPLLVADTSHER